MGTSVGTGGLQSLPLADLYSRRTELAAQASPELSAYEHARANPPGLGSGLTWLGGLAGLAGAGAALAGIEYFEGMSNTRVGMAGRIVCGVLGAAALLAGPIAGHRLAQHGHREQVRRATDAGLGELVAVDDAIAARDAMIERAALGSTDGVTVGADQLRADELIRDFDRNRDGSISFAPSTSLEDLLWDESVTKRGTHSPVRHSWQDVDDHGGLLRAVDGEGDRIIGNDEALAWARRGGAVVEPVHRENVADHLARAAGPGA